MDNDRLDLTYLQSTLIYNSMNYSYPHDYQPVTSRKRHPYNRSTLYQVVPLGSIQCNRFIDYMRSINFDQLYQRSVLKRQEAEKRSVASSVWICINCWEVILGHESKMEHINARHLLTSSFAESEPASQDNFIKLCRIYGRINPEETHVVLFYVP